MIEPVYRIIGFGESNYGFFNQINFAQDIKKASKIYSDLLSDPEMDGVVMIKSLHESWEVILEFGTENTSVVFTPVGTFKVEKAPQLNVISE